MNGLPEATMEVLRRLARSVALHRSKGGVLDTLPADQQGVLQALGEAQRQFFMEELAKAVADEGKSRFRSMLAQWPSQQSAADPDPEGVP